MFEYLKDYKRIFVTGMPRTGTTICARMIQYDIEASYCIWAGGYLSRITELEELMKSYSIDFSYPIIFHCPGLSHLIHKIKDEDEFAVIWMKRDRGEVVNSAAKMEWDPRKQLEAYNILSTHDLRIDLNILITEKDTLWEEQKKEIKNWFEVDYENLKPHRLWIDKEKRNWRIHRRITSPGMSAVMPDILSASEGGSLELLLKEFPKDE